MIDFTKSQNNKRTILHFGTNALDVEQGQNEQSLSSECNRNNFFLRQRIYFTGND